MGNKRPTFSGGAPRDALTEAQLAISTDHEAIHLGWGFTASHYAEAIADDGYLYIELNTPALAANGIVHLKQYKPWTEGGLATLEIIEAPTLTTGVAALTAAQRNRYPASPVASSSVLKSNPTIISGGTLIEGPIAFGGGGVGGGNGGNSVLDQEIVLKVNTTYLFRVRNLAGSAKALGLWLFWYEEKTYREE